MLRFAFDDGGLDEVWAGADPLNAASFLVMERLGMAFVGERSVGASSSCSTRRVILHVMWLRARGK